MIRLVVSDIDGTLVRNDKSLSDGVVAAVAELRATGVVMSLISARPPSGMLWIAEKLGLTAPIGAFNGGTVVAQDGTVMCAHRLDPSAAAKALAIIDTPGITPWLFADGRWYAHDALHPRVAREKLSAGLDATLVDDFSGLLAHVDKIVGVCDDPDRLADIEQQVVAAIGGEATVARSQPYFLDVTAPLANKGDGVKTLAEAIHVSLADTVVLGDQRNDLPMFACAGLAIAMGQAQEAVRAAADEVAASNEDDGVADAITRIILPRLTDIAHETPDRVRS